MELASTNSTTVAANNNAPNRLPSQTAAAPDISATTGAMRRQGTEICPSSAATFGPPLIYMG
jgi:hypothetical protein